MAGDNVFLSQAEKIETIAKKKQSLQKLFRTFRIEKILTSPGLVYIVELHSVVMWRYSMKHIFKIFISTLFIYLIFSSLNFVFSENMPENELSTEMQSDESSKFSYGTVVSVNNQQIVISEYDYEKDEEVENTYLIDQKTEIKGVNSILDITVDDNVDIVYVINDDKKIAQSISVEKPSEDEDSPTETERMPTNVSSNST